jgi:hypothetical protein
VPSIYLLASFRRLPLSCFSVLILHRSSSPSFFVVASDIFRSHLPSFSVVLITFYLVAASTPASFISFLPLFHIHEQDTWTSDAQGNIAIVPAKMLRHEPDFSWHFFSEKKNVFLSYLPYQFNRGTFSRSRFSSHLYCAFVDYPTRGRGCAGTSRRLYKSGTLTA